MSDESQFSEQEEISKLISKTNKRAAYLNQLEHARREFKVKTTFAWEGNFFTLDYALLSYVLLQYNLQNNVSEHVEYPGIILINSDGLPLLVEDVDAFLDEAQRVYNTALNRYHDKVRKLKNAETLEELYKV